MDVDVVVVVVVVEKNRGFTVGKVGIAYYVSPPIAPPFVQCRPAHLHPTVSAVSLHQRCISLQVGPSSLAQSDSKIKPELLLCCPKKDSSTRGRLAGMALIPRVEAVDADMRALSGCWAGGFHASSPAARRL